MSFTPLGRARVRISFIGKPREIRRSMLEIKCVYKFFRKRGYVLHVIVYRPTSRSAQTADLIKLRGLVDECA